MVECVLSCLDMLGFEQPCLSCSLAEPVSNQTTSTTTDNSNDTTGDSATVGNDSEQQQQTEVDLCCSFSFVYCQVFISGTDQNRYMIYCVCIAV